MSRIRRTRSRPTRLLDNALGAPGYYGAFTANMHTDSATIPQNDALIASAKARGVPIVSGKQMLDWIDGRNGSTYGSINWNSNPTPSASPLEWEPAPTV